MADSRDANDCETPKFRRSDTDTTDILTEDQEDVVLDAVGDIPHVGER